MLQDGSPRGAARDPPGAESVAASALPDRQKMPAFCSICGQPQMRREKEDCHLALCTFLMQCDVVKSLHLEGKTAGCEPQLCQLSETVP